MSDVLVIQPLPLLCELLGQMSLSLVVEIHSDEEKGSHDVFWGFELLDDTYSNNA